ncbi:TRAP transporter permease [Egibacter rhizosphaerae]|uniref:TRAP transporter permease n=1 Tax=Egibacter rhizosphaerae TaxID=1670831 RepID=A0A411YE50_9ACTN|nr:TRAP transporter permease [Egibacter rhizosphaerae]QBI19412.1 TRAP transporter permease [Egibacter rhizosphaerae]
MGEDSKRSAEPGAAGSGDGWNDPHAQRGQTPENLDRGDAESEDLSEHVEQLEAQSFADSQPGTRSQMRAFWRWAIFLLALGYTLFHVYTAIVGTLPTHQHRPLHLAGALGLIFLLYPAKQHPGPKEKRRSWVLTLVGLAVLGYLVATEEAGLHAVLPAVGVLAVVQIARHLPWHILGMPIADLVLAVGGFSSGMYLFLFGDEVARRAGIETEVDIAFGVLGTLLVLVAVQRVIGTPLVAVSMAALGYAYLGPHLPGFFQHSGYTIDRIIANSFLGSEGIFGTPIAISSTFIFMFMVFASMLQRTGMERFFTQLAFGATGWMTGGPGKVGVLTSAFSGTITGSSVANTVGNGAFTIPMMKRAGYKAEFAGAIEASSSTGGQLAPPIMGAAAFIMIEFTGIPYIEIIQAAIIPAILYFTAQFVVIHYESKRQGVRGLPRDQLPNVPRLMFTKGYLLIPIIFIFIILAMGFTPLTSALYAVYATVVVNLVVQVIAVMINKWRSLEDRLTITTLLDGLVDAARIALPVIAACAAAGLIAGVVTLTGLGLRLSDGILQLANETLIFTMIFAMIACLILGIGLPTTANYVITATLAAPALLVFDPVPLIAAHFFVYYFGVMADITPPVSLASYAASGIARSNPFMTGVQSVRIALGGFLVPYMFVLSPELLLQDWTWAFGSLAVITAVAGIFFLGTGVAGFMDRKLNPVVRALMIGVGLALLYGDPITDGLGLGVGAAVFVWQWWTGRSRRAVEKAAV